jgi:hypothetical protein
VVILHLITTIDRGGAEKQLFVLTMQQIMMGHEVHVVPLKGKFRSTGGISGSRLFSPHRVIGRQASVSKICITEDDQTDGRECNSCTFTQGRTTCICYQKQKQ